MHHHHAAVEKTPELAAKEDRITANPGHFGSDLETSTDVSSFQEFN
jgi:hypothetical protein